MVLNVKFRAMILIKFIFMCGMRQVFMRKQLLQHYMVKPCSLGTVLKSQLTINVWCVFLLLLPTEFCFPPPPPPPDEELLLTGLPTLLTHNHSSS